MSTSPSKPPGLSTPASSHIPNAPPTRDPDNLRRDYSNARIQICKLSTVIQKFTPSDDPLRDHRDLTQLFRTLGCCVPEIGSTRATVALPPHDHPDFCEAETILHLALDQSTESLANYLVKSAPSGSTAYARLCGEYLLTDPRDFHQRLYGLSYYDYNDATTYISIFQSLVEGLKEIRHPVPSELQSQLFLRGLKSSPTQHNQNISHLYHLLSTENPLPPVEKMIGALYNAGDSSVPSPSQSSPQTSRSPRTRPVTPSFHKKSQQYIYFASNLPCCTTCGGFGHNFDECPTPPHLVENNCILCKQTGHNKDNCKTFPPDFPLNSLLSRSTIRRIHRHHQLNPPRSQQQQQLRSATTTVELTMSSREFSEVVTISSKERTRVFLARVRGQLCAVKAFVRKNSDASLVAKERDALKRLSSHPSIISFVSTARDDSHVYIVTEAVLGGPLHRHIRKAGKFDIISSQYYASQIARALTYLHSLKMIHRDVKASNLVLGRHGVIKLIDFGSVALEERGTTYCGTLHCMAPEMIRREGAHDCAVDWWGLGIVFFEMLTGNPPFWDKNNDSRLLEKEIISGYDDSFLPSAICDVADVRFAISSLLSPYPPVRMSLHRPGFGRFLPEHERSGPPPPPPSLCFAEGVGCEDEDSTLNKTVRCVVLH